MYFFLISSELIIQNNAIYQNLFNINQSGMMPSQIQSTNTGTIPNMDSRFVPYPSVNNSLMPNNGIYSSSQMINMNNQSARLSHTNNSDNPNGIFANTNANASENVASNSIADSRTAQSINSNRSVNAFAAGPFRGDSNMPNISAAYNNLSPFTQNRQQLNRQHNNETSEIIMNQLFNLNSQNSIDMMAMNNANSNMNAAHVNSVEGNIFSSNGYLNRISNRASTSSASSSALMVNSVSNLENQNAQQSAASTSSSVLPSVDQFLHQMYGAMNYNHQSDYLGLYYNLISDNT